MRILTVSDMESKYLYDYYTPGKLDNIDLIIACGDLSVGYLEFLVTLADVPLLYVHGNHDDYPREPEGCICIDGKVVEINGLRIMGLGGSFRYREGKYMYTESAMRRRLRWLRRKVHKLGGVDIFVTHAPARHINDFETLPHRGFECFTAFLRSSRPRFFIHGHIHKTYGRVPRLSEYEDTTVINAFDHYTFLFHDGEEE